MRTDLIIWKKSLALQLSITKMNNHPIYQLKE